MSFKDLMRTEWNFHDQLGLKFPSSTAPSQMKVDAHDGGALYL